MKRMQKNMLIYSNDFKFLQLPKLTELELKTFLAILFKLQGQGNNELRLYRDDLFLNKLEKLEYETKIMDDLRKKFVSFAIRKITEKHTHIIDETTLFFKKIILHYQKKNPDDGYDTNKLFLCADIQINEEFVPYINDLQKRFAQAEMEEILSLSGYRNTLLYLDLRTFKKTGEYIIDFDDFKARYHIPENYRISEIRRVVLNPMLKELSRERTLFDQKRTPFKNLKFETLKSKGRVVKIKFSFKPETLKNTELTDEKKFDLGKLIGSKWYHRALGVFEITSGDISDKSNLIIDYSLENGDCGSFKFRNFNELQLKFTEFEPYA